MAKCIQKERTDRMSVQAVREYLDGFGFADRIMEFNESTATVELAAAVVGVIPARIAKTLSFRVAESVILVVAAGDAKIDNRKYKDKFGAKAKCLLRRRRLTLSVILSAAFVRLRSMRVSGFILTSR